MDEPAGAAPSSAEKALAQANQVYQRWVDKSTIYTPHRWLSFSLLLFLFFFRIYVVQGYFIIAYGLGIYLLNNFIAFLSPMEDMLERMGPGYERGEDDDLGLPTSRREGEEYRPFQRRLPEFKFWLVCTKGVLIGFVMTFISMFDVPVFWPILLLYFIMLFFFTMKRQIMHMYKHKYVPISWGKAKPKMAGVEKHGGGMAGSRRND